MRNLVAENQLHAENLILPVFIKEGATSPTPIGNMKGVVQHTFESLHDEVQRALELGVGGVMIFAIPLVRDEQGSEALNPNGILHTAVRKVREQVGEKLIVIADLCLDEFTDHGHCGVLAGDGSVDNDATLEIYARMGVQLAQAGAHMLGTSGMMDGQVGVIREALDDSGLINTSILAYSAKYSSAFYGPFRNAVDSQLKGDRKSYQQNPANIKDAMREIELDVQEGADIIMVKPGMMYLDVVHAASQFVDLPIATYIISGEMAMIEAAADAGAIDRELAILEVLLATKRAGANIICTYWANEVAEMLRK
jgi:porphobilinogen synthase